VSEATVDVADLRVPGGPAEPDDRTDDAPLREDMRLLGRVLGQVIGEQAGADVLELVESTRLEAFRIRRSEVDRAGLADRLAALDVRAANHVIRAFSHFSLLANLAEDVHHERRRRHHRREGSPPQKGSLAATFELLDRAALDPAVVATELQGALVSPVVTAHPTEVRRRTISQVQQQVSSLLRQRDGRDVDERAWSAHLWREVLTLWQTALLRLSRLRLADEIDEALRYYDLSLFAVVPAINAEVRQALRQRWPDADLLPRPMLLPGSWIGGDRDGNPFVTADAVRRATTRQAETALGHHLAELVCLADELSMSDRLVTPTDAVYALADASGDGSPFRADEPYRRALRGVYRRLAATAQRAIGSVPGPAPDAELPPYDVPEELIADLDAVDASLRSHGAGPLADDRLARLRDAVEVFGFHLCGLDMRQNSAVHEEVLAELLAWAGVCGDYAGWSCCPASCWCAGRWCARTPSCPSWPAASWTCWSPRHGRSPSSDRRRSPPTSSACVSRSATCWRSPSCSRRSACWTPGPRAGRSARSASRRCSRRSTTCRRPAPPSPRCSTSRSTARCWPAAATCRR
jgi:phosphoenolpyruvate carboxylase